MSRGGVAVDGLGGWSGALDEANGQVEQAGGGVDSVNVIGKEPQLGGIDVLRAEMVDSVRDPGANQLNEDWRDNGDHVGRRFLHCKLVRCAIGAARR